MVPMDPILPLTVHGPGCSYFTGKLEAVLRFKELPYQRISTPPGRGLARKTGVAQVPAVRLADGCWITDTTPMIAWLDERFPEHRVIPEDPVLAFVSRLVEDYADEWLWRPAMHYRWNYPQDAYHRLRPASR
jgi:glutathione S-transferase